jgi:hypothetical protein
VQSDGLIEKVRTNLILYSEQFNDASWSVAVNASVTANATTAPNGTTTADKIVEDTATSQHIIGQTPTSINSVNHTISVYAKAAERSFLFLFEDSAGGRNAYFDLSNGTIGTLGGSATASITSVGNGWYRCSVTYTASGTLVRMRVAPATANGTNSYTGDGTSGIFVWGAQVEVSDFGPTDYIATTTAAVSVGPVSGLPRLDYLGSTCPRLLLEPQRTNSAQYSEQLDNAWWTKNNQSVTANNTTAPDGYSSADLVIPAAGTADHYILSSTVNSTASEVVTLSLFIKKKDNDYFYFGTGGASAFGAVVYRFSTNTFTVSGLGATATNYGNGWIRLTITGTTGATDLRMLFTPTDATGLRTFNANGTDGTWVWGCQVEVGAYATSYIPTLGASVTRVADAASKTSASALIGQTEGTIFWEFQLETSVATGHESIINIDGGSFSNTIYILKGGNGSITAEMYVGGVLQAAFSISSQPAGTYKAAIGYANNNTAFFINGVQVGTTDTSCSVPTTSRIQLGNNVFGPSTDKTAQVLLFKTRLTNSQLAELTA